MLTKTKLQFPAIFLLGKDDEYYFLATGNKIASNEVNELETKLIKVNSLNKKELMLWYNEILILLIFSYFL